MSSNPRLNLPETEIRVRTRNGRKELWDDIRKKWLVCTPEEWVRQNFIGFLTGKRGVNPLYIKQEQLISFNGTDLRADIVVYGKDSNPQMVVECKAPEVKLDRQTLEQVCRYNMMLKVPYFCITNGLAHYCFSYDKESNTSEKLDRFPDISL